MRRQTPTADKDSGSLMMVLKKTTAMALLSVSVLAVSAATVVASDVTETTEIESPAAKLLGEWDDRIGESRKAFAPVLKALKLLAVPDFREGVEEEKGDTFAIFEKETVADAWAQQKVVVQFLKDLYGAHTKLIPEYYLLLNTLSQAQGSLTIEQGVSAELRSDLKTVRQQNDHLQQEAIDLLEIRNTETTQERDLEAGRIVSNEETPLVDHPQSNNPWKTKSVIALSTGCAAVGMGLGTLLTWWLISE